MKNRLLILALSALISRGFGQQASAELKEADLLFGQKRYANALPFYQEELKRSSSNGNVFYKAGVCYLNSRSQKSKAAELLEKAISNSTSFYTKGYAKETDAPLDAYLYLGDAYHVNYDFDKALSSYEKYKEMLRGAKITDESKYNEADARIEVSNFAKELKQTVGLPPNYKIPVFANKGQQTGESTSVLSPDKSTLIYTLKIPVNQLRKYEDERYFKPLNPEPAKAEIKIVKPERKKDVPDTIVNICTIGTSKDGQVVLTYHNEKSEACLYVIRLKDNKWTNPVKLAKTANTKGWEPGEYISADGRYLYFTSDRAGGFGGKDIYRCEKHSNGEWSQAENLGPSINTAYDEEAPYLHADGVTLYFSSNRFKPAVSYDILISKLEDKSWGKPVVVGYPINSSEEDIFYQVSEKKKLMLASADNSVIAGKEEIKPAEPVEEETKRKKEEADKNSSGSENILLGFEDPKNSPAAMLIGETRSRSGKLDLPLSTTIRLADLKTQQSIGTFYSGHEKGDYSILLPSGKKTGLWYEADGFLFASQHIDIQEGKIYHDKLPTVVLSPLSEGGKTTLNNVIFGKDDAVINKQSEIELQKVYDLLKSNPGMKVRFTNYIYAPDKSLKRLSNERADAIKTYFEEKGIDKKRIKVKGQRKTEAPGRDKRKGPPKPEDLEPVQVLELEITEITNN